MLRRSAIALTLSAALSLACFVDEPVSGSAGETTTTTTAPTTSSTSTSMSTMTMTTGSSSSDTSTSSSGGTTTAASSSVTGESESEGESSTTGAPAETLQLACENYCAFIGRCTGMEDPECLPFCLVIFANDGNPSAACAEAAAAMVACAQGIGCAAIEDLETACPDENAALDVCTACMATSGIANLTACEASLACQVDVHEAQCTSDGCTCSINGAESASCILGANPCAGTPDELIATARDCCKWPA